VAVELGEWRQARILMGKILQFLEAPSAQSHQLAGVEEECKRPSLDIVAALVAAEVVVSGLEFRPIQVLLVPRFRAMQEEMGGTQVALPLVAVAVVALERSVGCGVLQMEETVETEFIR
jgi:hypothetical protein